MEKYDVRLRATISIGGEIEAPTREDAVEMMRNELRVNGELEDLTIERAIWLHEEDLTGTKTREWGGA